MAKSTKVLAIFLTLLVLAVGSYFGYRKYSSISRPKESQPVEIPFSILNNKFGFLSGGPESYGFIKSVGGSWLRPHPGPFLWDAMQNKNGGTINFATSDKIVKEAQKNDLAILATLWPFAEWDQRMGSNTQSCAVPDQDEFLAKNDKKGHGDYLPVHRCAPVNWEEYQSWVKQTVERYDGDGTNDMPDLELPIKYWEVMNEPDLPANPDGRLVFWRDTPDNYGKLLIKTYQAIKEADSGASVVIAGAAGGGEQFLNFYRQVFKNPQTLESFDIANIHCISNDSYENFNVEPYKKMLEEFRIKKPVWVTEAEIIISDNASINATQTWKSSQKALDLGAEKIFFTRYEFTANKDVPKLEKKAAVGAEINGDNPIDAYKRITGTNL